ARSYRARRAAPAPSRPRTALLWWSVTGAHPFRLRRAAASPVRVMCARRIRHSVTPPSVHGERKGRGMKCMVSWFERPQGSALEYENAQKRILGVFRQWEMPSSLKLHFFVVRVGEF